MSASTPYTRSVGRLRTLVMLGVLVAPTALAAEATRRVLLLGDDLALPASSQQLEGLRAGLHAHAPVKVFQESLDVMRFSGAAKPFTADELHDAIRRALNPT